MERRAPWLAVLLLAVFATLAVTSSTRKSVTVDEITYIAAGYVHLRTGDFSYNATNPPLMKMVGAAPLLLLDLELPEIEKPPAEWNAIEEWQYARRFLYENRVDADRILLVARLPIVLLGVLLGGLLYVWAAQLYGRPGGCFALLLYSFSPNLLAHTRLVTQDLGLAAVTLASTWLFWRHGSRPRLFTTLGIGALLGCAATIKSTAALMLPAWALVAGVRILRDPRYGVYEGAQQLRETARERPRRAQLLSWLAFAAVASLTAVVTMNAVYGFSGAFAPLAAAAPAEKWVEGLASSPVPEAWVRTLVSVPTPFPEDLLRGLLFQARLRESSGRLFFAGELHPESLWYLMAVALLVKTPLPSLLLGLGAAAGAAWRPVRRDAEWLVLGVAATYLVAFSVMSNIGGGVRYVLPLFPCLFLVSGRWLRREVRVSAWRGPLLGALGLWYVGSCLWIHPHYLAYFNESIGGPSKGHEMLAESNLDWGQDLEGLAEYLEERDVDRIQLAYFGSADARYYGIDYDYLPSVGLAPTRPDQCWWYELRKRTCAPMEIRPGLLAVSTNLIARPQWIGVLFGDTYAWLADLEPIDSVGYSILIYRIE